MESIELNKNLQNDNEEYNNEYHINDIVLNTFKDGFRRIGNLFNIYLNIFL